MNSKEKKLFSKKGYFIRENVLNSNECKKISQILMKAISKENVCTKNIKVKTLKWKITEW